jgi:hypothetical protein
MSLLGRDAQLSLRCHLNLSVGHYASNPRSVHHHAAPWCRLTRLLKPVLMLVHDSGCFVHFHLRLWLGLIPLPSESHLLH